MRLGITLCLLMLLTTPAFTEATEEEGPEAAAEPSPPEEDEKSFWSRFKDPQDGKFDVTAGSGSASGFLPVVIPFNDPAVGGGLTMALIYFHPRETPAEGAEKKDESAPPSMTFGGGAYADNGSWAAAAGHMGIWKGGSVRYTGALLYASADLEFYGIGSDPGLNDDSISFNIEGGGTLQEIKFRLGETRLFAGTSYVFLDTDAQFQVFGGFPLEGKTDDAGLTAFLSYDSRDNVFTPNVGTYAKAHVSRFAKALGGDFNYTSDGISALHYQPVFKKRLILGFRLDYQHAGDDSPFYALPWVHLRGIPAFRYLGNYALTSEVEPRWKIDDRWSVLAFFGAGRAAREYKQLDDAEKASSYGAGFRYLLSRKLGLTAGFDLARGAGENTLLIIFGSAW